MLLTGGVAKISLLENLQNRIKGSFVPIRRSGCIPGNTENIYRIYRKHIDGISLGKHRLTP